jgi:predicted NAD-dependent protein-ADP-ribosyltransferase YbiA (DUF1768 family)
MKPCGENKIRSPISRRCVTIGGDAYNKLISDGVLDPSGYSKSAKSAKSAKATKVRLESVVAELSQPRPAKAKTKTSKASIEINAWKLKRAYRKGPFDDWESRSTDELVKDFVQLATKTGLSIADTKAVINYWVELSQDTLSVIAASKHVQIRDEFLDYADHISHCLKPARAQKMRQTGHLAYPKLKKFANMDCDPDFHAILEQISDKLGKKMSTIKKEIPIAKAKGKSKAFSPAKPMKKTKSPIIENANITRTKDDKLFFYSKSASVRPGKGVNEVVLDALLYNALGDDFRKVLSNFHMCPFKYNGHTYNTIEHVFQAEKIALVHRDSAYHFTIESGHEIGIGDGTMAQKARKLIKLDATQLGEWNRIKNSVMVAAASAKYEQCEEAHLVLQATLGAQLWHVVPRGQPVRFSHLEDIRSRMTLSLPVP